MDHHVKKTVRSLLHVLLTVLMLMACALPASAASGVRSVYESYKIAPDSVRMTAHRGYSAMAPGSARVYVHWHGFTSSFVVHVTP